MHRELASREPLALAMVFHFPHPFSFCRPEALCNCDAGEAAWSYDDGQLTDRSQLPVTKLNFGHLDGEGQVHQSISIPLFLYQEARFQLGPLYCSGEEEEEEESIETDSCLALWRAGDTQAGYRMVRSHLDTFPKVGGGNNITLSKTWWCTVTEINYLVALDSNVLMEVLET